MNMSSNFNPENYRKQLFELKKMCDEIYFLENLDMGDDEYVDIGDSVDFDIGDDQEFFQKFVQTYNFVFRYYIFFSRKNLFKK